jgi:CheY-like chemotaxis protein
MFSLHHQQQPRVLVADDDASIRQLLSTLVRREGLEVDTATDGVEAVDLLRQNDYAAVLLDLMMPRMNGFEVVEFLREHPRERKPLVIAITAYTEETFKELDPGIVVGVVRKPFEIAALGQLLRAIAEQNGSSEEDVLESPILERIPKQRPA